jgi:UDP-N-acetylglucosamine--N-acetylmuramyl-(pentapeptide) pyrophosphoryl-undecaprenol N-acetylglucosamine transferase
MPALAVALESRRAMPDIELLWIGTSRSRERELCEKHSIALKILNVQGLKRQVSTEAVTALFSLARELGAMSAFFKRERYDALIAFGGYVSAPALAAARMRSMPYFLHEQNTVPGLVNKLFARSAACCFLGFPLVEKRTLKGETRITGTPVRKTKGTYDDFDYPQGFDRTKKCMLISGGSQGAASMNKLLIEPVATMCARGMQVVWQTGPVSRDEVAKALEGYPNAFVFDSIDDLYPYYARSRLVLCRAGAGTLSEVAYFGLPAIMIPLPWASENHQWSNAGLVEHQGWGIRIAQNNGCAQEVVKAMETMLDNKRHYERMCQKALDNSPHSAAADIVNTVIEKVCPDNAYS